MLMLVVTSLNSNIRCIEIFLFWPTNSPPACWIVTLDVLKFIWVFSYNVAFLLNSNIRCIEIKQSKEHFRQFGMLNSNIRCIEICFVLPLLPLFLTLNSNIRCIEIRFLLCCASRLHLLDSNIRCIEIVMEVGEKGARHVE